MLARNGIVAKSCNLTISLKIKKRFYSDVKELDLNSDYHRGYQFD